MAGYSGTPLAKKLGIKEGNNILLVNQPSYYQTLFEQWPDVNILDDKAGDLDFIHLFVTDERDYIEAIEALKKQLKKDGMLWVSWPKKMAKVDTNLDGNKVREIGLMAELVDVKVCAVDDTWSGLKFVYRKKDR